MALPGPAGLAVARGVVLAGLAGQALGEVGHGSPAACQAAAGEPSLFRCRYRVPGEAGSYEVTVTPSAGGDGAVVTNRPAPDPHGARPVR